MMSRVKNRVPSMMSRVNRVYMMSRVKNRVPSICHLYDV